MKSNRLYWVCQLSGWLGMVFIETINYTFFIVGKFQFSMLWTMLSYAFVGLATTHAFTFFLKRYQLFQQKSYRIWIAALLSTLITALIIVLFSTILSLITDHKALLEQIRFIDIAGTIMNWMRYTGVWVIIYFMYKILQQHNQMLQEKLSLENLAKTTELELLKTQLNPHFLFNALNSIKALVTINPVQSRAAIVKLSELLRFTLQYGRDKLIPLNNELEEVKKYLELEQLRFGERLEVQWQIADDTIHCQIPPAMLLTLAENAVKHGVTKQMGNSRILIISFIEGVNLVLQIYNDGKFEQQHFSGIGLRHVTSRLQEIYHNKASFQIVNEKGKVQATIKTPLIWQ